MADKIIFSNNDNRYGVGNFDPGASSHHKTSWTEGLPHDFKGWGPRTPDPDESPARASPSGELVWRGDDDHHNHYVWHFDGRRRHH